MVGITCYSSEDLVNWKNEGVALPVVLDDENHDISKDCVMERPKVIYNEKTKKFVMWFHLELKGQGYAAARAALAVSDTPNGPFTYVKSLRPNAGKWPMNLTKKERKLTTSHSEDKDWWTPEWRAAVENGYYVCRDYKGGQMSRDMTLFVDDELDCNMVVLWLAREGTLCAESKSPVWATKMLVKAIDQMLSYDEQIRVCIEPKPNEPIDRSICGTMGHVLAIGAATIDPARVGGNLESAHAILAGLDPAHEIGFALAMDKLMTVHLNDQNGIKYDQDKSFGVENLRAAFNQVKVLKENNYGSRGEYIGLDVKAMRTTKDIDSYKHLENSLKIFKALEEKVERFDYAYQEKCVKERDFESLEMYVLD